MRGAVSEGESSSLGAPASDPSAVAPVMAVPPTGALVARRYRVDGVLGRGAMGVVLAVTHVALGKKLAIKLLAPDIAQDATMRERFEREALAVSVLRGRHIVRTLDVDVTDDGIPFIVMERLKGRDLLRACGPVGTMPLPRVVDWLIQVCSAMHEPHSIGIVHRDLKPSNILVTQPTGLVKVLDFGVSKIMSASDLTITRSSIGTPRYMAPEQLRGDSVDQRADVWAIGTIMYRLLAGRFPFDGAEGVPGEIAAIRALIEDAVDVRRYAPDLPEPLAVAIMSCLEREPAERMASVADLAAALAPFGSGEIAFERVPEADSDSQISDLRTALADAHGRAREETTPSQPSVASRVSAVRSDGDTSIQTPRPFALRASSDAGSELEETASEAQAIRLRVRKGRLASLAVLAVVALAAIGAARALRKQSEAAIGSGAPAASAEVHDVAPAEAPSPSGVTPDVEPPKPSSEPSGEPQKAQAGRSHGKDRPKSSPPAARSAPPPTNKPPTGQPLHL